ncbi:MAG: galactokinase family protein, partial [Actinobacteria bacterium]|nr:galactokinase family protein [Actinomycetota bacterium]
MSIRDSFSDIYGLAPDLISAAPGRVNLIGEHVDYNDGFVLPFAIEARTYCALRIREDTRIRIASKQEGGAPFETDIASLKALTGPI